MRLVIACLALSLVGSVCYGQAADTSKTTTQPPTQREVFVPGVDTPVSGPGLTAQVPINEPPVVPKGKKQRKTQPPSDPRSFGVSVPLEKTKRDTLRNQR